MYYPHFMCIAYTDVVEHASYNTTKWKLDGDSAPPPTKGHSLANFHPISVVGKWLAGLRCHLVWR